jgi:hypothetical protein
MKKANKAILAHLKITSLESRRAKLKANNNLFFEESTKRVRGKEEGP